MKKISDELTTQEEVDADREDNLTSSTQNSPTEAHGDTPYLENNFNPSIFGAFNTGTTDNWWLCDSDHIYSVGTSVANASQHDLKLYQHDIIIGMKATDTSGFWDWSFGTDFHSDAASSHKVAFTIYHTNNAGTKKVVMDNYHLAGGNNDTGQRYISFLPWEPGDYTVVFNETVAAGECAKPEMPDSAEWYRYTVTIQPPDEGTAPDWSDWADDANYQSLLNDFYDGQGLFGEDPEKEVKIIKVVAVSGILTGAMILVFGLLAGKFK